MSGPEFCEYPDNIDAQEGHDDIGLQAEQSVLGALLSVGAEAYDQVATILKAEYFAHAAHQEIWRAAETAILAGGEVDVIEMMRKLEGRVQPVYLNRLEKSYVSSRGIQRHAEIVAGGAAYRRLQKASQDAAEDVNDIELTVEQRVAKAAGRFEGVIEHVTASEPRLVQEFAIDLIDEIQDLADGNVTLARETGIPGLDQILAGGVYEGQLIVIAARPSVGKSSFAQQLSLNLSRRGAPSAFIGMEMTQKELTRRAIANLGRVSLRGLKTGKLSAEEFSLVPEAIEYLRDLPLYVDFSPGITLVDVAAKARKVVRKYGVKFLVVDYLQLMEGTNPKHDRRMQLQEITRGLKRLAGQLGITIALLSQLNREVEKRSNPRPTLSDLKESGSIEEDADVVLALWDHRKGGIDEPSIKGLAALKGRDVGQSEMALHFEGKFQRWTESTESLTKPDSDASHKPKRRYPNDF